MDLKDVPYNNLFEEFIRRISKGEDRVRFKDGVAIMREIDRFAEEFTRRVKEVKKRR